MKKLIFIFLFSVIAVNLFAQAGTFRIAKENTMAVVENDFTLTNTVESYFVYQVSNNNPVTVDYQVLLTKGTGSNTEVAVTIYGRKFEGDAWTQIGSTVLAGVITTTATVNVPGLAPVRYREFKASLIGTGIGTTTISKQIFKVWNE